MTDWNEEVYDLEAQKLYHIRKLEKLTYLERDCKEYNCDLIKDDAGCYDKILGEIIVCKHDAEDSIIRLKEDLKPARENNSKQHGEEMEQANRDFERMTR